MPPAARIAARVEAVAEQLVDRRHALGVETGDQEFRRPGRRRSAARDRRSDRCSRRDSRNRARRGRSPPTGWSRAPRSRPARSAPGGRRGNNPRHRAAGGSRGFRRAARSSDVAADDRPIERGELTRHRRAASRNSTLPSGPVIGLSTRPSTVPAARTRTQSAAAAQTRSRTAGSRTTPALADLAPLRLELRLDQSDQPPAGPCEIQRAIEHLGERDEARVADDEVDRLGDDFVGQIAGVGLLMDDDPGILAKLPGKLVGADVDRINFRRAALKQDVGEASGRGADIQRDRGRSRPSRNDRARGPA